LVWNTVQWDSPPGTTPRDERNLSSKSAFVARSKNILGIWWSKLLWRRSNLHDQIPRKFTTTSYPSDVALHQQARGKTTKSFFCVLCILLGTYRLSWNLSIFECSLCIVWERIRCFPISSTSLSPISSALLHNFLVSLSHTYNFSSETSHCIHLHFEYMHLTNVFIVCLYIVVNAYIM
jgi:hypothetical protein